MILVFIWFFFTFSHLNLLIFVDLCCENEQLQNKRPSNVVLEWNPSIGYMSVTFSFVELSSVILTIQHKQQHFNQQSPKQVVENVKLTHQPNRKNKHQQQNTQGNCSKDTNDYLCLSSMNCFRILEARVVGSETTTQNLNRIENCCARAVS